MNTLFCILSTLLFAGAVLTLAPLAQHGSPQMQAGFLCLASGLMIHTIRIMVRQT